MLGSVVIGPGVRGGDPNREVAVTPAWREGVWLVSSSASWSWNATADDTRRARREMQSFSRALRAAYPESGTYVNEASVDEAHWQRSFWATMPASRLRRCESTRRGSSCAGGAWGASSGTRTVTANRGFKL